MTTIYVHQREELGTLPKVLGDFARAGDTVEEVVFGRNVIADNLTETELRSLLQVIFPHVNRRLRFVNTFYDEGNRASELTSLKFLRTVMESGFAEEEDFDSFVKPYRSQTPVNWSYLPPEGSGFFNANGHKIYDRVLGNFSPMLEDMVAKLPFAIGGFAEIMSGSAMASLNLSWAYPELEIILVDQDRSAFRHIRRYHWPRKPVCLPHNVKKSLLPNADRFPPKTLGFIGKQSYSLFPYHEVVEILDDALDVCSGVLLEMVGTTGPHGLASEQDMTTAIMAKMGVRCSLDSAFGIRPISGRDRLQVNIHKAYGAKPEKNTLIEMDWFYYQPHMIYHMALQKGWTMLWYDQDAGQFLPADYPLAAGTEKYETELNYVLITREKVHLPKDQADVLRLRSKPIRYNVKSGS